AGIGKPVATGREIAFPLDHKNPETGARIPERTLKMAEQNKSQNLGDEFWYRGKVTRRRLIGYGAGMLGATMLVPAPWQAAFGQAKPFKIGSLQPLSGAAAAGGQTAAGGLQMAGGPGKKTGGNNERAG